MFNCTSKILIMKTRVPGRPTASSNACKTDKVMWLCVYNHGMNVDCVVKRSVALMAVTRQMWKTRFGMI